MVNVLDCAALGYTSFHVSPDYLNFAANVVKNDEHQVQIDKLSWLK